MKTLNGKKRPVLIISSDYHNSLTNATLLVVPITSKLVNTAIHQFHISPHDTVNETVIRMRSIILLDFSSFIHPSRVEPVNDYLQNDIFISFVRWWRWRINGLLPSYWLLTVLFILNLFSCINKNKKSQHYFLPHWFVLEVSFILNANLNDDTWSRK